MVADERERPDVKRRRDRWQRHQGRIDPTRLVFIDETWVKTNMAPLRGWAPKGERLPGAAPFGHWNTSTFIAALRHDRIDAPWVFDGPVNGDIFRTYVERVLAPTLRPGDVVVMDNLGSHKSQAVRQAIRPALVIRGDHNREQGALLCVQVLLSRLRTISARESILLLALRW